MKPRPLQPGKPIDTLVGERYGELRVIKEAAPIIRQHGWKRRRWACECSCGERLTVTQDDLRSGKVVRCNMPHVDIGDAKMKPVFDMPGYYVTDDGRVLSRKRRHATWRKLQCNRYGYMVCRTMIDKSGRHVERQVHTMILEAFIGPRPEGMQCRHRNGNCKDNRLPNLVWGTAVENQADAIRHGTAQCLKNAAFSARDVLKIVGLYDSGTHTVKEIASIYGVSLPTIYNVINRQSYEWAFRSQEGGHE